MITKVYVAGASKELARAQDVIRVLEAGGVTVTSTWPSVISKVGAANPMNATPEQLRRWTRRDLLEVEDAEVLLLLLPAAGIETVGAYVELGFAARAHKFIITSGTHRPIFTPALSDAHFETDSAAFGRIIAVHEHRCYAGSTERGPAWLSTNDWADAGFRECHRKYEQADHDSRPAT